MKLSCPNQCSRKLFRVTAHVAELWVTDENGDFIGSLGSHDVVYEPGHQDLWICSTCRSTAEVSH